MIGQKARSTVKLQLECKSIPAYVFTWHLLKPLFNVFLVPQLNWPWIGRCHTYRFKSSRFSVDLKRIYAKISATCMEDRAMLGSDPSAIAGGYTNGGVILNTDSLSFPLHSEAPQAINPRGFGGQRPPRHQELLRRPFSPDLRWVHSVFVWCVASWHLAADSSLRCTR